MDEKLHEKSRHEKMLYKVSDFGVEEAKSVTTGVAKNKYSSPKNKFEYAALSKTHR
jgi:hypothetical protein